MEQSGEVAGIYCETGGGLLEAGLTLKKHYDSEDKVLALLNLGDLYSLGPNPIDEPNLWVEERKIATGCKTFRGRELCGLKPLNYETPLRRVFTNEGAVAGLMTEMYNTYDMLFDITSYKEFVNIILFNKIDMGYLFKDNKWLAYIKNVQDWIDLNLFLQK